MDSICIYVIHSDCPDVSAEPTTDQLVRRQEKRSQCAGAGGRYCE